MSKEGPDSPSNKDKEAAALIGQQLRASGVTMARSVSAMQPAASTQAADTAVPSTSALPAPESISHTQSAPASSVANKPLILIADDTPMNLKMLQRGLQGSFNVVTAVDGQEAYDKYTAALKSGNPFKAVVSDNFMPKMNGSDLLVAQNRLSEALDIPRIPHVTISGNEQAKTSLHLDQLGGVSDDVLRRQKESKADEFYVKGSYKMTEVVTRVKELIASHSAAMVGKEAQLKQLHDAPAADYNNLVATINAEVIAGKPVTPSTTPAQSSSPSPPASKPPVHSPSPNPLPPVMEHGAPIMPDLDRFVLSSPPPLINAGDRPLPSPSPEPTPSMPLDLGAPILPVTPRSTSAPPLQNATPPVGPSTQRLQEERNAPPPRSPSGHGGRG